MYVRIKYKQCSNNLLGHLPIPSNFTTVGKPQIFVNQYDNPIEVYSEETIDEMKEERISITNPQVNAQLIHKS